MTDEPKNLIKNISKCENYGTLGVFTSSSSVYLCTTLKRKNEQTEKNFSKYHNSKF